MTLRLIDLMCDRHRTLILDTRMWPFGRDEHGCMLCDTGEHHDVFPGIDVATEMAIHEAGHAIAYLHDGIHVTEASGTGNGRFAAYTNTEGHDQGTLPGLTGLWAGPAAVRVWLNGQGMLDAAARPPRGRRCRGSGCSRARRRRRTDVRRAARVQLRRCRHGRPDRFPIPCGDARRDPSQGGRGRRNARGSQAVTDPTRAADLVRRRARVRVHSGAVGCGDHVMAEGTVVAWCAAPSLTIVHDDGTRSSWATTLPIVEVDEPQPSAAADTASGPGNGSPDERITLTLHGDGIADVTRDAVTLHRAVTAGRLDTVVDYTHAWLDNPEAARQELAALGANITPGTVTAAVEGAGDTCTYTGPEWALRAAYNLYSRVLAGQWREIGHAVGDLDAAEECARIRHRHQRRGGWPDHPGAYLALRACPTPAIVAYDGWKALGDGIRERGFAGSGVQVRRAELDKKENA